MSFKKRRIVSWAGWLGAITSPHKRRVSPGRCILGGHFQGSEKRRFFKGRISRTLVYVLVKTLGFFAACVSSLLHLLRNNLDLSLRMDGLGWFKDAIKGDKQGSTS